jgi:hypothetical protein
MGQNPPSGAIVTYQLASAQPVTLEFLDSRGQVVKTFSSSDRPGPAATPGLHRFAWDMRYPDAHGLDGGTHLAGGNLRGPIALPGNYQVRLRVGGETYTKPLRIVPDPRSEATSADLEKQFELLTAIRDKLTVTHDAANDAVAMRKQALALADRARDTASVATAAAQLAASLEAIQKELVDLRFAGYDDQMLAFDLKLNNRIAALQGYVSQGDYAPTDQQEEVFRELSQLVDAQLSRLEHVIDTDVPAVNKLAAAHGMPTITRR